MKTILTAKLKLHADSAQFQARIASPKICLCNRFKLHAAQRIVGMFNRTIPAFPPPLETAESGVRCKNRSRF
jgi:hypothetical protein